MIMRNALLVFVGIALLLLLASCGKKPECKASGDCNTGGICDKGKCAYNENPGVCGNKFCESAFNEDNCNCPKDCTAQCSGKAKGTNYMQLSCTDVDGRQQCVADVPKSIQKPLAASFDASTAGIKVKTTVSFNQPFSLKRDKVIVKISMSELGTTASEVRVSRVELLGKTPDKREVTIGQKQIDKPLWLPGPEYAIDDEFKLDFPTGEKESDFKELVMKLDLQYFTGAGISRQQKAANLKGNLKNLVLEWANPDFTPSCPPPEGCDDRNPATEDVCIGGFCEHQFIPGTCGNYQCEAAENQCSCARDCGPCSGSTKYLTFGCFNEQCTAALKAGVAVEDKSVFDDRNIGAFHLQNSYKYRVPFNTNADTFNIDFELFDAKPDVTNVKITTVRLLEGSNEIAVAEPNKVLPRVGAKETVNVQVPAQAAKETDRSITVAVWYEYIQNQQLQKGSYQRAIGKITFVSPSG